MAGRLSAGEMLGVGADSLGAVCSPKLSSTSALNRIQSRIRFGAGGCHPNLMFFHRAERGNRIQTARRDRTFAIGQIGDGYFSIETGSSLHKTRGGAGM